MVRTYQTLGEYPNSLANGLLTSTARTYIFVENIEIWVSTPLILCMETFAYKTLKSCLKGHNILLYFEKPLCTFKNTYEPMSTYSSRQEHIQHHQVKSSQHV